MRTSARSVAVVLFDEVELLDVALPVQVLTLAGRAWNFRPFKLFPVANQARSVETRSQMRLEARFDLTEVTTPEIVLVPGGYGARRALSDERLVAWLELVCKAASHVVGIGNGVLLLAKAGALDDRDVAVPLEMRDAVIEFAPTSRPDTSARVRESGPLESARTASGGAEIALRLVERHLGGKQALGVAEALGLAFAASKPVDVTIVE